MTPVPVFDPETERLRPAARLFKAARRGERLFGCWQCGALVSEKAAPAVTWAGQLGRWCPACWSALVADAARDRAAGDADPDPGDPPLTPEEVARGAGIFGDDEPPDEEPAPVRAAVSWAAEHGDDDPADWGDLFPDEEIPADDCLANLRGLR